METIHRVIFGKPNLSELTANHTVVDMHFHSQFSDGLNRVGSIVRRATKLGIGIAITDHNAIEGAVRLADCADILTIPGIEVTSREGAHLLVYFYSIDTLVQFYELDVRPFMGKSVMTSLSLGMHDIIRRARQYKSLILFPHPYSAVYTGICNPMVSMERQKKLLDMVDGVEVINAGNLKKWNLECAVLGFNLGKCMTGGSDGHNLFQMGKAVTYADCPSNRTDFLNSVKNCHNQVIGKETAFLQKVTSNGFKIKSSIKNSPHVMGKNIRFSYSIINSRSKLFRDKVQRKIFRHDDRTD